MSTSEAFERNDMNKIGTPVFPGSKITDDFYSSNVVEQPVPVGRSVIWLDYEPIIPGSIRVYRMEKGKSVRLTSTFIPRTEIDGIPSDPRQWFEWSMVKLARPVHHGETVVVRYRFDNL